EGSTTLRQLARQLGARTKEPVAYNPFTQEFVSAEEREGEIEALGRWHLQALLNFVQRDEVVPDDYQMVSAFTALHMHNEPHVTEVELKKFAAIILNELRRFLLDRQTWRFDLRSTEGVLEPAAYPAAIFKSADWRTAFRLRAADLVARHHKVIRKCERKEC